MSGKLWYHLQLMPLSSDTITLREKACDLRKMSLEDHLAKAKAYILKGFVPGTIFICLDMETRCMRDGESVGDA